MVISENEAPQTKGLPRYPLASFRELITLSFPLILSCLSASLLGLCDRLFLSHYSLEAWNAASTSGYIAYLYQMVCIVIAMIAQTFIGQYLGAKKAEKVGPVVWQMIWFAFLSMLITYPTSFLAESYFTNTEVESAALSYFRPLALCNFLFPLSTALSAFFIGRLETRVIFFANLSIQLLNIALDYFLIFGVGSLIPPLGTFGAALATILSQATLCLILFTLFSKPEFISTFRTDHRALNIPLLKKMLKVGIPRAIGRGMAIAAWSYAAHILVKKGGDHLLVLTFGTSLLLIFTFVNDGMAQAFSTIASRILGAQKPQAIHRLIRSAFIHLSLSMLVLSIPLLFMREHVISFFIADPLSASTLKLLKATITCIWVVCLANGINVIGTQLMIASRDTFFYACLIMANWITICIPTYLIVEYLEWPPQYFFLIDSVNVIFFGIIYLRRFKSGVWKKHLKEVHEPIKI